MFRLVSTPYRELKWEQDSVGEAAVRTVPAILVLLLGLTTPIPHGQPPVVESEPPPGSLLILDRNKDDVIDPYEALDALLAMEEELDEPITIAAVGKYLAEERREDIVEATEMLETMDTNGDSFITAEELCATDVGADNIPAGFRVADGVAVMSGVITSETPARVLRLVFEHPDVRTIEMTLVPGSIDDEANLRAAAFVRRFGPTTLIRSQGAIASGGTDFFLGGKQRVVEPGARLGIHSWGGPGFEGQDVPRDDPQHRLYLDYYNEMGIPAEFYWHTLEAAPADGIHWMTEPELERFRFRTGAVEASAKGGLR